jgi:hypothetical protein
VANHPASRWPTTSFFLCRAQPGVAKVLGRLQVPHFLPLYATLEWRRRSRVRAAHVPAAVGAGHCGRGRKWLAAASGETGEWVRAIPGCAGGPGRGRPYNEDSLLRALDGGSTAVPVSRLSAGSPLTSGWEGFS